MASLSDLPDEIILVIFSQLNDRDLLNCACACPRFKRISRDASLWRRRQFVIHGYCRSWDDRIRGLRQYVQLYGSHLRYLKVQCAMPTLLTAQRQAMCVDALCKAAVTCDLQELHVTDLNFDSTWGNFHHSRARLVGSMEDLLRSQKSLVTLVLANNHLCAPHDVRLIKACAKSRSTRTLVTLDLVDFNSPMAAPAALHRLLARCCTLTELRLNYYTLMPDCPGLLGLVAGSLQQLVVYVCFWEYTRHREVIDAQQWRAVKALIPELQVTVLMHNWFSDPSLFLVAALPLLALEVRGRQCRYSASSYAEKAAILLRCLAARHCHTLRHVILEIEGRNQVASPLEESMVHFLDSCPQLLSVSLSASLLYHECSLIQKAFARHRGRGVSITLTSPGATDTPTLPCHRR